jgi:Ca2+/H+ antiporter
MISLFLLTSSFLFLSLKPFHSTLKQHRERKEQREKEKEEDPWKNWLVIFSIIIFTSISLCYRICGFFFVYKISPDKKIAHREELHGLVMTGSFLYNHLYQIWTI